MRPLASAFLLLLAAAGLALAAGSYRVAAQSSGETPAETSGDLAALRQMALSDDLALLNRMIGQMIMVGFLGYDERDQGVAAVRDQLAQGVIGGVVLYPENIRSARQLRNLTALLANAKSELVPLIAVDQEGGLVQRLTRRNGYVYFPSARNVGRDPELRTEDGALRLYGRMAKELASAGINLNFGPVVDLNTNPANPVIGRRKRSFGSDPKTVTELARAFIIAHRDANVLTSPKHFPGHGSSRSDSHKVLPDISRTWGESELDPYRLLAKEGLLDMVMVGHLYHPRFSDGETVPTSLSARAISALRAKGYIGFRGVVVSDDMEMGAVRKAYSLAERAVMAINAGTDIIVFSNVISKDAELGPKIHAAILDAVRDGRISRARIEQAYGRILLLKRRLMQHDLPGKW
jgi:beta-N-acetylhexosaminidase